jgi:hypothetical protein
MHATAFVSGFLGCAVPAQAGFITFTDRAAFLAALGSPAITEDYESYGLGAVANGSTLGDLLYTYDSSVVQPAIVPGGFGGQALGGPFEAFVGGDAPNDSSHPPSKNISVSWGDGKNPHREREWRSQCRCSELLVHGPSRRELAKGAALDMPFTARDLRRRPTRAPGTARLEKRRRSG